MRLLSIGRPLRHRAADNHTIANAPAWFDYDLIALDPGGIFRQISEVLDGTVTHQTTTGLLVLSGASSPATVGLGDLLRRRREETHRALERGAVVVVFLYPPAVESEVPGLPGVDRYFFLPAPAGMAWDVSAIRWGEGTTAAVTDPAHPFARVFEAIRPALHYRAYFDERAPGFAGAGRVFARSVGGAALGVHFPIGAGHLVFLPTPAEMGGEAAGAQATAIIEAAQELLGRTSDIELPGWVRSLAVPGLTEREAERARAEAAYQQATVQLTTARSEEAAVRAVRDIVLRSGRHGLVPAVERCLTALGFAARSDDHDPGPMVRSSGGVRLYVEVEGNEQAVEMGPHYRLRARLDAVIEREGQAPRGLLVVNGYSRTDPAKREQQYTESLRVAAEATRYALITASELYAATCYGLGEPDAAVLTAIRERLATTDGVVTLADLLPA